MGLYELMFARQMLVDVLRAERGQNDTEAVEWRSVKSGERDKTWAWCFRLHKADSSGRG